MDKGKGDFEEFLDFVHSKRFMVNSYSSSHLFDGYELEVSFVMMIMLGQGNRRAKASCTFFTDDFEEYKAWYDKLRNLPLGYYETNPPDTP